MTRKDFIIIADILVGQIQTLKTRGLPKEETFPLLLEPTLEALEKTNSSFNEQKFRDYILKKI